MGGPQAPPTGGLRPPPGGLRPPVPSRKLTNISQVTHINFLPVPGASGPAGQRSGNVQKTTLPRPLRPAAGVHLAQGAPEPCLAKPCWAGPRSALVPGAPAKPLLFTFQSRRLAAPTSSTPFGTRTVAAGPEPTKNHRKTKLKLPVKMNKIITVVPLHF